MSLKRSLCGLATLALAGCEPPAHVLLKVIDQQDLDGNGLAADADALGVGSALAELERVELDGAALPFTVTLYGPEEGERRELWVDALDADGIALARGWAAVEFSRDGETVEVPLWHACERAGSAGEDCALGSAQLPIGICRSSQCAPQIDASQSTLGATPASAPADGSAAIQVSARPRDALGEPVPLVLVGFEVSGPGASLGFESAFADGDGVATTTVTSVRTGLVSVTAVAEPGPQAVPLGQPLALTFVAGEVDLDASTVTVEPALLANDDVEAGVITVTLLDGFGNPVPGQVVELSADGPDSCALPPCLRQPITMTDVNGQTRGEIVSGVAAQRLISATARAEGDPPGTLVDTAAVEFIEPRPEVTSLEILGTEGGGCVELAVTLWELRGRPVDLVLDYRGSPYRKLTPAIAGAGVGFSGVNRLGTSAEWPGRRHRLLWDTHRHLADAQEEAELFVTAISGLGLYAGIGIPAVTIDNRERWEILGSSDDEGRVGNGAPPRVDAILVAPMNPWSQEPAEVVLFADDQLFMNWLDFGRPVLAVTHGDVDNDTNDELIVLGSAGGGSLGIYEEPAVIAPDEAPSPEISLGFVGVDLAVNDVDGDGHLDAVIAKSGEPALTLCYGDLMLPSPTCTDLPVDEPPLFLDSFTARVPRTTPSATHQRLAYLIAAGATGAITRHLYDLDAAGWTTDSLSLGEPIVGLAHGNFSNDDVDDLVVAFADGSFGILTETAPGAMTVTTRVTAGLAIESFAVADLDGDGDDDLVFTDGQLATVGVLSAQPLPTGPGTDGSVPPPTALTFALQALPSPPAIGAIWAGSIFAGEGIQILVAGAAPGDPQALTRLTAYGRPAPPRCDPAPVGPRRLPTVVAAEDRAPGQDRSATIGRFAVGDVDGDGWRDLFAVGDEPTALELYLGSATVFSRASRLELSDPIIDLAAIDVDGDGASDVAVALDSGELMLVPTVDGRLAAEPHLYPAVAARALMAAALGMPGATTRLVVADGGGASPAQVLIFANLDADGFGTPTVVIPESAGTPTLVAPVMVADFSEEIGLAIGLDDAGAGHVELWRLNAGGDLARNLTVDLPAPPVAVTAPVGDWTSEAVFFVLADDQLTAFNSITGELIDTTTVADAVDLAITDLSNSSSFPTTSVTAIVVFTASPAGATLLWAPNPWAWDPQPFAGRRHLTLSGPATRLWVGDADGDQETDLLFGGGSGGGFELLLGSTFDLATADGFEFDLHGAFSPARIVPEAKGVCGGGELPLCPEETPGAFSFAVHDIAHPGRDDLVLLDHGARRVRLLFNGYGDLCADTSAATGDPTTTPHAVAVGLFDGDGIPDLAVLDSDAAGEQAHLTVHLGQFQVAPAPYDYGSSQRQLLAGLGATDASRMIAVDLNRDGFDELIITDPSPNGPALAVLRADGVGGFTAGPRVDLPAEAGAPVDVTAVKLFGDGSHDLVLAAADADGLLLITGITDPSPTWAPADPLLPVSALPLPERFGAIRPLDLNADGYVDLVGTTTDGRVVIYLDDPYTDAWSLELSASAELLAPSRADDLVVADLNRDGQLDVAVLQAALGAVATYRLAQGAVALDAATFIAAGDAPVALASGRFDSNRAVDLAVLRTDGRVQIAYDTTTRWPLPAGDCLP